MPEVIAYPGTEGSFSWSAAREVFPSCQLCGYRAFSDAVTAVTEKKADFTVMPVENSFAGAVVETYKLIERLPVHIVGEHIKRISHNLLGLPGAELSDISKVSSHPQAIAQCDEFLSKLRNVQIIPSANTAISAKDVAQSGDITYAAIASSESAETYGLKIIRSGIETSKKNFTRFIVLSRDTQPLSQPDKATVVFTVANEVGSLAKVLQSFAESGLNMSRIESRPLPDTTFTYFFVCDFEGPMDSAHLNVAMTAAKSFTSDLRLLGVYKKAD